MPSRRYLELFGGQRTNWWLVIGISMLLLVVLAAGVLYYTGTLQTWLFPEAERPAERLSLPGPEPKEVMGRPVVGVGPIGSRWQKIDDAIRAEDWQAAAAVAADAEREHPREKKFAAILSYCLWKIGQLPEALEAYHRADRIRVEERDYVTWPREELRKSGKKLPE